MALARAQLLAIDADALFISHLPNIAWLTGFFGSSGGVLLTADSLSLVTDFRYAGAIEILRAEKRMPEELLVTITDRSVDEAVIALIEQHHSENVAIESDHMAFRRYQRLEARLPKGTRLLAAEPFLEHLRAVKDPVEQGIYRQAVSTLAAMAAGLPGLLTIGRRERDVAADIDFAMKQSGFDRPAFETIVASGPNSALPHARPSDRELRAGDSVVLDFGGVYGGYCVDLTRTAFIGHPTEEFLRVFDAVGAAQAAAIAVVRDGVHASEVDAAARQLLSERGLGEAFGHATGHGLGIDVHEYPRIGRVTPDREDPVLQTGMIVTIEPGAYLPGLGGVRIEDDVLVGTGGAEVLTDIPRGLMIPGAR
jgi:Xaa-Pro aminopeptidase